jgi:hypothetical protein
VIVSDIPEPVNLQKKCERPPAKLQAQRSRSRVKRVNGMDAMLHPREATDALSASFTELCSAAGISAQAASTASSAE